MECPYCGSSRIIERDGEYVCTNCGSVLGSVYVYDTYTHSSPLVDSDEVDLTPIWKSVENSVKRDNSLRLNIYRRLRVIDRKLRLMSSDHSIYRAFNCIDAIARSLGIDKAYAEEAKMVFRKIMSKAMNERHITYYQAALASMIYVILTNNLPVSTKLAISVCKSMGHKLSLDAINEALIAMGTKYSLRDRVLAHVRSGLVKLFGDSWVSLYPKAERMLNGLRKSFIQSKSPTNLAAAIIYCVSKEDGREVTLNDVAKAVQVSPFTLREYVSKLCP